MKTHHEWRIKPHLKQNTPRTKQSRMTPLDWRGLFPIQFKLNLSELGSTLFIVQNDRNFSYIQDLIFKDKIHTFFTVIFFQV